MYFLNLFKLDFFLKGTDVVYFYMTKTYLISHIIGSSVLHVGCSKELFVGNVFPLYLTIYQKEQTLEDSVEKSSDMIKDLDIKGNLTSGNTF